MKKTISTVQAQTEQPLEHIIVDGSNNSEINDYLAGANIPGVVWKTERDKGISDAFNKGVERSQGTIVHLLNSGDYYYDEYVVMSVMNEFRADQNLGWTHGMYYQYVGDNWVLTGKQFNKNKLWRGFGKTGHQTMFVKKELYHKHGLFSLEKKMAMDYDFLVRIKDEPFKYLEQPIVYFAPGGVSNQKWKETFDEVYASHKQYLGFTPKLWLGKAIQYSFYWLNSTALFKWYLKNFKTTKN
ncbi:MAG: glycosyltransferase [Bacteroidetes bacterium]|nr:glycosyltransferase [Bacteroidota bacterium]